MYISYFAWIDFSLKFKRKSLKKRSLNIAKLLFQNSINKLLFEQKNENLDFNFNLIYYLRTLFTWLKVWIHSPIITFNKY